jgi:hypothetical protein
VRILYVNITMDSEVSGNNCDYFRSVSYLHQDVTLVSFMYMKTSS